MRIYSLATVSMLTTFVVACFVQSAVAGSVTNATQLLSGGVTQLKLTNYEYLNHDAGTLGTLDVGDTIRGIFVITSGLNSADPNISLSGFELTGIFETEVLSVNAVAGGPLSFSDFTFGPSAAFGASLGIAGAMVAFYEDTTPNFSFSTIAGGEASATDGTLALVIGAKPGSVFGTDYFWTSEGYATLSDNGLAANVTAFAASLQFLYDGLGVSYTDNQTQAPTPRFPGTYASILNEFALQGNVKRNPFTSEFPLQSQDPVQFNGAVVPEPASIVAWLGLSGLTLARRRRKN